ncbi:hypothetical protein CIPAW_01G000600 [Carya illinoinensis]|uniref:Uncharacterized protein n=1 Tax=Carya illinoinensis TaxID=32201 RepID=A0A8T1RJI9_CARIL|nr:hypothetical protein CIPAW_01G000600 [Carya illinoinensis]
MSSKALIFILARKLKLLKQDLKFWNEQVFGNVPSQRRSLLEELQGLEGEQEARTLTKSEKTRKSQVVTDLERALLMQEIYWRQKSRALWLHRGHNNLSSFKTISS